MQQPGGLHGTHHVVATLHDGGRDVANFAHVVQQLRVRLKEPAVDEVMAGKSKSHWKLQARRLTSLSNVFKVKLKVIETSRSMHAVPFYRHHAQFECRSLKVQYCPIDKTDA